MSRRPRTLMVLAAACAGAAYLPSEGTFAATTTWAGATGAVWSDVNSWNPVGLPDGLDTKFDAAGSTTSNSTVTNIVDADRTLSTLHYRQFGVGSNVYHTTEIQDGRTLTLNGSSGLAGSILYAGSGVSAGGGTDLSYTYIQNQPGAVTGGTLSLQNPGADLIVRQTSSATTVKIATLDMSRLSNFNADIRDVLVGAGDATYTRAMGILWLAQHNTINANSVVVGHNTSGTTRNPSARLYFGATNTINTNSITIGSRQTPDSTAGFAPAVTGGSLVIRGAGGVGRADLGVAANPVGVTVITTLDGAILDLTGGSTFGSGNSVDARLGNVVIGRAGFGGVGTTVRPAVGTFNFASGVVDANDVVIGDDNATANLATGTGTINITGTGSLVANNSVTLGKKSGTTGNGLGTLNLAGGKARVSGPVTDGGGTSTINVTANGSLQARSLGSAASRIDTLTLDSGTVVVDVSAGLPGAGTAWGYVNNLTANNSNTIGLNFAAGTLSAGQTIKAIDYTSLGGGGFGAFNMAKQPARVTAHLANGANSIDIVIDSADSPKWDGTVGASGWDIATTNNWKLITAGTATNYQEDLATYSTTDTVLFNDDAAVTNVNVTTTVAPNAITVNNPTKSYTYSGAGKITGSTGIVKQGAGSLTIGNTGGNDFTGLLDVQGGTVATGAANVLPNGGAIRVGSTGTLSLGDFSDTVGSVNIAGGSASLNNATLTAETVTVGSGSLSITGTGTIAANVVNYSGGTVSLGAGSIAANTLNLSNGVTIGGAISGDTINLNDATLAAGNITPDKIVATVGTINATIGGVATLTKNNAAGTLTLNGNNTYTGVTTYNDGILRITNSNALGSAAPTSNTILNNGGGDVGAGYLELSGDINVPEPITFFGRRGFTPANMGLGVINKNPIIVNASGNNTLSGPLTMSTGGTNYALASNAGKLTITGDITNAITGETFTRFIHLRGAGEGEVTGGFKITGTQVNDIIKMDAGTWTLSGANDAIQKTTVEAGTLAFGGALYKTGTLDVQAGTLARVNSGGGSNRVLRADSITIGAGAKIDLKDNKLITNLPAGSATGGIYNGVEGMLQTAYTGGSWSGSGITTSAATSTTSIGVISAAQKFGLTAGATATFAGQTVTDTSTLAMYTYGGDANLDGIVSGDDYSAIDFNIATPGASGWANGDFNHDGIISGDDYSVIDFNIVAQGAPFPTSGAVAGLSGVTAVPEPASIGVIGLAAASLMGRRRRRN